MTKPIVVKPSDLEEPLIQKLTEELRCSRPQLLRYGLHAVKKLRETCRLVNDRGDEVLVINVSREDLPEFQKEMRVNWRHVFDGNKGAMQPDTAMKAAYDAGYKFVAINDTVYFITARGEGPIEKHDSGIKVEELS